VRRLLAAAQCDTISIPREGLGCDRRACGGV